MTYASLYLQLAEKINDIIDNRALALDRAKECVFLINNITSEDDVNAKMVSLKLLYPLVDMYTDLLTIITKDFYIMVAVREINNFYKKYVESDLAAYVNGLWDCVPYYWADLSEQGGENIENWNVCEVS